MIFSEFHNDTFDLTIDFYGFEQCAPKYGFDPAIRENFVLHYIEKGQGFFCYKGKTITLKAGDLFLLKPNELTYYEADKEDPWAYYWLGISGSKSLDYFRLSSLYHDGYLKSSPSVKTDTIGKLTKDIIEKNEKLDSSPASILHLLGGIYELLSQFAMISPENKKRNLQSSEKLCSDCRRIIETTYTSPKLSIHHIADKLSVSRNYLSSKFSERYQISPKEYLQKIRMNRAKYLLENSEEPIKVIAYSVGFSDPLYFSKAFKHYFNTAPSDIRKIPDTSKSVQKI